jgi:hypothetical protein
MRTECNSRLSRVFFFLCALTFLASDGFAIENRSRWDEAFRLAHPGRDPCLEDPGEFPGDLCAWHGHYWIRAHPLTYPPLPPFSPALLDHVKGGRAEYRKKATAVPDFWRGKRREVRGGTYAAYDWNYYLRTREFGDEDFPHSHVGPSFFVAAHRFGILTTDEMKRIAATLTEKIYRGNGAVAGHVDGSGSGESHCAACDRIDLAGIDPRVLSIAKAVYRKHYRAPSWSRPFLGWAEILRWSAILA